MTLINLVLILAACLLAVFLLRYIVALVVIGGALVFAVGCYAIIGICNLVDYARRRLGYSQPRRNRIFAR